MLIVIPLFMLLAWRSGEVTRELSGEERAAMLQRDSLVHELTGARTTVKALAMDAAARAQWIERHAGAVERSIERGRQGEVHHHIGHALTLLTTVAMTSFGALAILDGQITIGALIASNILASRIVGPFHQLVRSWRDFVQARQAAARLDRVFGEAEERGDSSVGMPRPQGRLRLENLAYRYDAEGAEVVDHVHLQVGPGGLHAIVGPNGSGKSTLLKLIRGLYQPREGRVLLDGADIAQFTRIELGGWIGYLAQDTVLFAGSIEHNIIMADPDADDARVVQAAQRAGVHDIVVDLPQGYATDIGEAGQRLSAGVRQRIALARALVTDPPVLLLDEPSSNLDIDAEARLAETLVRLAEDHTILVVTHSPTLLEACATIAVMDHGRIRMGGPAAQVLPQLRGGRATTAEAGATPISAARKGS
jgi:ABC-type bacteriocin/lantibiotic exporter with double-glycine peptidase domain